MKFVASLLNRFSAKADDQTDIFDKRLTKMVAPAPARNRRARSAQMPSAFRGRQALAH